MRFDPAIAAMRHDRAPQARAQAAMVAACNAWRGSNGVAEMLAELGRFGTGAELEACPMLDAMFTAKGEAERIIEALCRHFALSLRETPFGHPPFRQGFNGSSSTLLLAHSGRAQLLLQARDPGTYTADIASFSHALRYDAVLAGQAEARFIRRAQPAAENARLFDEQISIAPGARLALDCRHEMLHLETVESRLVVLRLLRRATNPVPTREYDLASGALVHQSCGDIGASRQDMMVALLGRMKRTDAAPVMAEMAQEPGQESLRWQALREGLALDTAGGFTALCAVARRADDPLAAPAGTLRAGLLEAHPQLRELEFAQCPA